MDGGGDTDAFRDEEEVICGLGLVWFGYGGKWLYLSILLSSRVHLEAYQAVVYYRGFMNNVKS